MIDGRAASQAIVAIASRNEEAKDVVTLRFDWDVPATPGQFVMVWVPGVDEVPMSLSYLGARKGITVKGVPKGREWEVIA